MKNEIITFTITMIFIIIIITMGDAADRPDDGDDISGEINNRGIEGHLSLSMPRRMRDRKLHR